MQEPMLKNDAACQAQKDPYSNFTSDMTCQQLPKNKKQNGSKQTHVKWHYTLHACVSQNILTDS
jgi:hypothetical protein